MKQEFQSKQKRVKMKQMQLRGLVEGKTQALPPSTTEIRIRSQRDRSNQEHQSIHNSASSPQMVKIHYMERGSRRARDLGAGNLCPGRTGVHN